MGWDTGEQNRSGRPGLASDPKRSVLNAPGQTRGLGLQQLEARRGALCCGTVTTRTVTTRPIHHGLRMEGVPTCWKESSSQVAALKEATPPAEEPTSTAVAPAALSPRTAVKTSLRARSERRGGRLLVHGMLGYSCKRQRGLRIPARSAVDDQRRTIETPRHVVHSRSAAPSRRRRWPPQDHGEMKLWGGGCARVLISVPESSVSGATRPDCAVGCWKATNPSKRNTDTFDVRKVNSATGHSI